MVLLRMLPGTLSNASQKSKRINRVNFIKLSWMPTKTQHQDCLIRSCLETSIPWNCVSTSRSHRTFPKCNYHPIPWIWNSHASWAFPPTFSRQCLSCEIIFVTLQREFVPPGCTQRSLERHSTHQVTPFNNYRCICTQAVHVVAHFGQRNKENG